MSGSRPHISIAFDPETVHLTEPEISVRNYDRLIVVGLILLPLIAYFPTLFAGFLPQDAKTLTENPAMKSWLGLWYLFCHPNSQERISPLGSMLFHLQYQWSTKAISYHLSSLFTHIASVLVLWMLLKRLEVRGAVAAAVLFAVHPINTQTIAWVSMRPILLCTLSLLCLATVYFRYCGLNPAPPASLAIFQLPESRTKLYVWSILLFVVAITLHPIAAIFPVGVLAMIWWERGRIDKRDLKPLIPFILIALAVVGTAAWITLRYLEKSPTSPGFVERLVIFGNVFWYYLGSLISPLDLSFAYNKWELEFSNPRTWIGPAATAAVLILPLALRSWIGRGLAVSVWLYAIALLPQCLTFSVENQQGSIIADYVAYLPAIAIFVGASALAASWIPLGDRFDFKNAGLYLAGAIAIFWGVLSFNYSREYRDPKTLWQETARRNPNAVPAYLQLGQMHFDKGDFALAEEQYVKALRIEQDNYDATLGLGRVYENQKPSQLDRAFGQYFKAMALATDPYDALCAIGGAYAKQGDTANAIDYYTRAIALRDKDPTPYNNIALVYADRGDTDRALEFYQKALDVEPRFTFARINRANIFFARGDVKRAEEELEAAAKIDGGNFVVMMNAGAMCGTIGLFERAEQFFVLAIRIKPDYALAWNNLGITQMQLGKFADAVYAFSRAEKLEPDNRDFKQNLSIARRESTRAEQRDPPKIPSDVANTPKDKPAQPENSPAENPPKSSARPATAPS